MMERGGSPLVFDGEQEVAGGPPTSITAATATSTAASPTAPVHSQDELIQQMRAAGFGNVQEVQATIRKLEQQKDPETPQPLTVDTVICALVAAREEEQLARDMDQARRLSEQEHELEQARLKEQRKWEQEERLLHTSLHDLLHPVNMEDRKQYFPRSWLLRHEPIYTWLVSIWNKKHHDNDDSDKEDSTHLPIKKGILRVLQQEKNVFRWYVGGIPKMYFTWAIGKRLMDCKDDTAALQKELQTISFELEEGTALPSKQNKDRVPLIFIQAKQDYDKENDIKEDGKKTNHKEASNNDDDDDDDDIQVLGEEEIRQLQQQKRVGRSKPPAAIEVDDGG